MHKTILKTNNGENQTRYDIRLGGSVDAEPSIPASELDINAFRELLLLMRQVVDQPDLARHAVACPARVSFEREGNAWVCIATCFGPREET